MILYKFLFILAIEIDVVFGFFLSAKINENVRIWKKK